MRIQQWVSFVGVLSLANACGVQQGERHHSATHSESLFRIIGTNDLVKIGTDQEAKDYVRAIGRMELGCTATHVGHGIAISAGHCFAENPFEGVRKGTPCGDEEHNIRWGLTYGSEGYLTSKCVKVLAHEFNENRDYTIFKVSPEPSTFLSMRATHLTENEKISIYSHPRKRPLEWSGLCAVEKVYPKSHGNQFSYECDTEGGSSGASVLDENNQIVGIHNFYNSEFNRNGATFITSTPLSALLTRAAVRDDVDSLLTATE